MKIKKDKTISKPDQTENGLPKAEKFVKKAKKSKAPQELDETKDFASASKEKPIKSVNSAIFQYFTDLTNEEEQTRMKAAIQLLQQISKTKDVEKRQKELTYTLKRLVRGCGASTNASRAGFFTGLVAFLKAFNNDVTVEQIFEAMQKELHVGATISNKEDADAIVGKILTCGSLLHSDRITNIGSEHLEQIINTLLQSTKHRSYHSSLGYSFLIELLEKLSQEQFEASAWPLLRHELVKPWPKQTLQSVHCLIATHQKFPNVVNAKFLKAHFGGPDILNAESYQYLLKIFWQQSNTNVLIHPAFELFSVYIAGCSKLSEFWVETVDTALQTPTKLLEIETLKIAADILNNLNTDKTNVADLLSTNFMRMLLEGLKNMKQKKDEMLKAFYDEFLEALVNCCATKVKSDAQKVAVIRRLILSPGIFSIEKYTNTRIVHQIINYLGEEGVVTIFELYKSIFLATLPKNKENASETWLNFERQNAGYILQHLVAHKAVSQSTKWREKQLRFFITCGIFYVNDTTLEICKKDACGNATFSKDFGDQCKNMFYSSLQSKLTDLKEEQKLLFNLVHFCNEKLQQKHALKYLRIKNFDEKLQQGWKQMYDAVSIETENTEKIKGKKDKSKKNTAESGDKLQLVFHILLLNMGLQLFREPEMALPAIDDLLKCMQRTKDQKKGKQIKGKEAQENDEEPEWIEVVVDLFLQLLSHNASALRNIVNALFPHLCDNLNLSAVHQILAMLDMKDGQNPLSAKGESDDEKDENEDGEDENAESDGSEDQENEETNDSKTNKNDGDDDDEDDDDEDDDDEDEDDDDDDDDDEEEETITDTDKLRNAISQALIDTGTGIGHDDDMDSIDLNDMTEEEGKKLDEALANAFKVLKKPGSGAQSKKSKSYRVQTTTVMHFRIRVLDLIEIYLQHQPTLLISIEIMLALYDMLQYCTDDELKPLQIKVEKVLTKLTSLKQYIVSNDLKEDNIVDFITLIIEKKTPAVSFDLTNKLRNKCIVFLIGSSHKIAGAEKSKKVLALCEEYADEFIKSRNPTINITLLSDIFKLRWAGVWSLATLLAQRGINMQTRTFRRIQIYEILAVMYKNHELLKQDEEKSRKKMPKIEKPICEHIKELDTMESAKLSAKEFKTLLDLLVNVQHAHTKLEQKEATLTSPETCTLLQNVRRKIKVESMQCYQRFCTVFKLKVIRNNEVDIPVAESMQNGHINHMDVDEEDVVENKKINKKEKSEDNKQSQTLTKRKNQSVDLRKEKKLKKAQRMQASSKGLSDSFAFTKSGEKAENGIDEEE